MRRALILWCVVRLAPHLRHRIHVRRRLAAEYLAGRGIEIGALHMPLLLPPGATARYLDHAPATEQREHFPELRLPPLVSAAILDDGERLATVGGGTQDSVIANHVLEHTQDPIGTLGYWLRVLRPGGILYFSVPGKRHTFDRNRPLTPLAHLLRDHAEGAEWSFEGNITEIAQLLERLPEEHVPARVAMARDSAERPHFHVWTRDSFRELLDHCRTAMALPFGVETLRSVGNGFTVLLRGTAPPASTGSAS